MNRSWMAPVLPPRRLATVDAWNHGGRVELTRFERENGGPSLRLILETDLDRADAKELLTQALDRVYGEDE